MKEKIIGVIVAIILIVLVILGYDYYKVDLYEAPSPITDKKTGKILSTPMNAIQSIPPNGIIKKDKPF